MAKLWEIDEKYDVWNVLELYDIAICTTINKVRAIEEMKEGRI